MRENEQRNSLFPVFLKTENLRLLLVGAGNVGLEKLQALLSNAPLTPVTIVAPYVKKELSILVRQHKNCVLKEKIFEESDLEHTDLVFLATDDKNLHRQVKRLAKEKGILVNVADTPDLCDFYLGSIVQKGQLKIAISTNGYSPTIAKRVKEVLQDTIPDEIDELLYNMQQIRNKMGGDFAQKVKELNKLTAQLSLKQESGATISTANEK